MIYGYARVSTAKQKEDRQLIELEKHGVAAILPISSREKTSIAINTAFFYRD